ncbi:hypothetical protein Tco_0049057, partial [Tanacetum coccineum]
ASLDATQDGDNIFKSQSTTMPNVDIPQGMDTEGHTSGSRESRMEHTFELMDDIPPKPHDLPLTGVLNLENAKDAQAVEILKLKQVASLDNDLDEEDASKQERIKDKTARMIRESDFDKLHDDMQDAQEEIVNTATDGVSTVSTLVTTAGVTISTVEPRTPPTTITVFDDKDVTMAIAKTLIKMKEQKAKEKGVAFREEEETPRITTTRSITTLQPLLAIDPKDKGKGVLVEKESDPSVKVKRSNQGDA